MSFQTGTHGDTTALGRPRTFINIVLDASSSMGRLRDTTIAAYNDFIRQQRTVSAESKDEVFASLFRFSDAAKVRAIYALVPLEQVTELTPADYHPEGLTALYDGIWLSIEAMERAVGEHARVLCLVITDGDENNSRIIPDIDSLREIVETREARGNWTFAFLSAGSNPYATGAGMGFKPGNVQTYSAGNVDTALARVNTAVTSYRRGDAMQTDTFWHGDAPKHERPAWTQAGTDDVEDVV